MFIVVRWALNEVEQLQIDSYKEDCSITKLQNL